VPALHTLAAFAIAAVVLILIPGPSVLFVVGRSLSYGRRGGLLSVLGNELGAMVLVAAVAFGAGSIVAESIVAFTVVKFLGAVYLVFLGVQAIRHRGEHGDVEGALPARSVSAWKLFRQGFVVGVTNPKTTVFFLAVLPQFVDFAGGDVRLQMLVLGALFTLIALVCDSMWALLASSARAWFARSPRRLRAVRASGGGLMVVLGGSLALSGSKA